jgi:hypothetical protein
MRDTRELRAIEVKTDRATGCWMAPVDTMSRKSWTLSRSASSSLNDIAAKKIPAAISFMAWIWSSDIGDS